MGFTKKLIEKYPLKAFWTALPPKFNAESLSLVHSLPKAWAYLKIEYAKFSLDLAPPIRHNVSDAKFGNDKVMSKKTTSIKRFSKIWQQKRKQLRRKRRSSKYRATSKTIRRIIITSKKPLNTRFPAAAYLLDIEMSGGIRPSIIRASGVAEGGKDLLCASLLLATSKPR